VTPERFLRVYRYGQWVLRCKRCNGQAGLEPGDAFCAGRLACASCGEAEDIPKPGDTRDKLQLKKTYLSGRNRRAQ
jgi:hypothetical protein